VHCQVSRVRRVVCVFVGAEAFRLLRLAMLPRLGVCRGRDVRLLRRDVTMLAESVVR
jgi:hypothetical protein